MYRVSRFPNLRRDFTTKSYPGAERFFHACIGFAGSPFVSRTLVRA
jgi:hypothetical protein